MNGLSSLLLSLGYTSSLNWICKERFPNMMIGSNLVGEIRLLVIYYIARNRVNFLSIV